MKPKIVQITAIDGSMNNMLNLLNQRAYESDYEVHCICSPGPGTKEIIDKGYKYHPVNIDRKISPLKNIKSILNIYKVLKSIKPDIVHVHTPIAAVLGRIAAKLARVNNIIYTAHGFYFHEGMSKKQYNIFFNIEKYIGRYFTDYIFTQSKEDFEVAKKNKFLKNNENYLHISNGIDVNTKYNYDLHNDFNRNKIREKYNIENDDLLLIFVGRLVKEKGLVDLLKAFKGLGNKNEIKLMVLGDSPKSERDQSIKNVINKTKREEGGIIFTGRVNNVEDFLFASDIFILPSYREGMPRSIIEAMAMKNAIIATNIRGSREEVDDGINGFLVETNSPASIKNKIIDLYNNKEKLEEMKLNALKKAAIYYDEEKVVSKQLELFQRLL